MKKTNGQEHAATSWKLTWSYTDTSRIHEVQFNSYCDMEDYLTYVGEAMNFALYAERFEFSIKFERRWQPVAAATKTKLMDILINL